MKPFIGGLIIGNLLTVLAFILVAFAFVPGLMIVERETPLDLDSAVAKITTAVQERGWALSSVMELEKSVKKHGGPDVLPVRLINICQAHHAGRILADDSSRKVSVLMPCTIAVYKKQDGKTYIGSMNTGLMGKLFGGVIAEVMAGQVAQDQDSFISAAK